MSVRVQVDAKNPGQFFACCGLFELAARLSGDAIATFDHGSFRIETTHTLTQLLDRLTETPLEPVDVDDETSSPLHLAAPFDLRLDWWKDERAGGKDLKVWAGSMRCTRIARAMIEALRDPAVHTETCFDVGRVVYEPNESTKKVEPFYFDARRAINAHSRDVGFSADALELTTIAYPAVEALCLVGLQRFRPAPTMQRRVVENLTRGHRDKDDADLEPTIPRRVFDYRTWSSPLPISVAAAVTCGCVHMRGTRTYRFENWFRTGQRKHRAFRPAVPIDGGE